MTFLTPDEVCEQTQLCRATVYELCKTGKLRATKLCGKWRIYPESVEEWIQSGEPEPGVAEPRTYRLPAQRRTFRMLAGGRSG